MAAFLAVTIGINYYLDFEDSILDSYQRHPLGALAYFAFYAFAYLAIAIPVAYITDKSVLGKKAFWAKVIGFFMAISIAKAFVLHEHFYYLLPEPNDRYLVAKVIANLKKTIFVLLPFWLLKQYFDKNSPGLYGLTTKGFNLRPYLLMLLFMVPLIAWASFQPAFQKTYPMYKPWLAPGAFGLDLWQAGLIYETVYAWDFVMVELIYRGALVLGMASLLGSRAVLPMVATYAFLHFGKPLAETIGSIFGGYILGVISLYSRSIFGGCLIHIGVAMLMDFAAYCQYFLRQ